MDGREGISQQSLGGQTSLQPRSLGCQGLTGQNHQLGGEPSFGPRLRGSHKPWVTLLLPF